IPLEAKLNTAMRGARLKSRPCPARRWISVLALLTFLLQGLTLQTHVHQPFQPAPSSAQSGSHPEAPLKLDPIDQCRLCQELVHAGTFIAPSADAGVASLHVAAASLIAVLAWTASP